MRFIALNVYDPGEGEHELFYVNVEHVVYVEPATVPLKFLYEEDGKVKRGTIAAAGAARVILASGKWLTVVHDDAPHTDATPIEVVESVINKLNGAEQ